MKILYILIATVVFAAALSAQNNGAAINTAQPDFSAFGMDGKRVDLADFRGKVVVINLWFINCPNCIDEIKLLNQLVDIYKGNKDVVFLGLAANGKPELEKFLKKHPFGYQIIPNANMIILTKFGTPDKNGDINVPFPMHYVLDRDGKIVVKIQGIKGVEAVKKELASHFNGKTQISKQQLICLSPGLAVYF